MRTLLTLLFSSATLLASDNAWLCRAYLEREGGLLVVQSELLIPGRRERTLYRDTKRVKVSPTGIRFDMRVIAPLPARSVSPGHGARRMLPAAGYLTFDLHPEGDPPSGSVEFQSLRDPEVQAKKVLDLRPFENGNLVAVEFLAPSRPSRLLQDGAKELERRLNDHPEHAGYRSEVKLNDLVIARETELEFARRAAPFWRPVDTHPAVAATLERTEAFRFQGKESENGALVETLEYFVGVLARGEGPMQLWYSEDDAARVYVVEKHSIGTQLTTSVGIIIRDLFVD